MVAVLYDSENKLRIYQIQRLCWNPEWVQVVHLEGSMLWELSSEYAKALGHIPTDYWTKRLDVAQRKRLRLVAFSK
jgi:hypothetical protein